MATVQASEYTNRNFQRSILKGFPYSVQSRFSSNTRLMNIA